MAGTAYPKRAIKQNRRTTRAKIGKPVKLARMGEILGVCTCRKYFT